jgi:glycosyltransferase involved in cell wall biosynthesis
MTRKILVFSLAYYPNHVGGAEVAIKEITDRISPDSYEFHVLTLGSPNHLSYEKIGNAHVHRVPGFSTVEGSKGGNFSPWAKYVYIPVALIRAVSLHRTYGFDAVWSMMASYAGFAAVMFSILYPKLPFILTLQEGDPIPHIIRRARPAWPLFRQIFKRAAIVQAISNYLAVFAKDMGATCPVVVIPNAVDVKQFACKSSGDGIESGSSESFPTLLMPKHPGDVILVTTGRLVYKNAVDIVIDSMTRLPQHVKFLILGIGELEQMLKQKARLLGLENRVVFGGFVSHVDMPSYLHQSDIFIRPSRSEGFGNSFIEAMAAGVPVVATSVGGIGDFLKHEDTGLVCEVDNPESVATQIARLMSDTKLKDRVVANSYAMVQDRYDWELIASNMKERIFEQVFKK